MKQKKLMLLGGIRYLLPVIKAAHDLGVYVITADYLPDNIAHKYSDEYVNVSILDREAVLKVAKEKQIDGILSFGVDPGVVTAAYVAEMMKLPFSPLASVEILQNKDQFRDFLQKNGFNCPWHFSIDFSRGEREEHREENSRVEVKKCRKETWGVGQWPSNKVSTRSICSTRLNDITIPSYPCIVKPVDSAGSKGCSRVNSVADLPKAIEYARSESHNGRIIIEQFLEKVGHSSDTDSFSINNELVFCSFNCQHFDDSAVNPYTPSGYTWPSDMPSVAQVELRSDIQRLIRLLNLGTSIYNIETRYCTDGKPYIMELSPRGGGNRLAEILTLSTDQDLIKATVLGALGLLKSRVGDCYQSIEVVNSILPHCDPNYNGAWAEVIVHSNRSGKFVGLSIPDSMRPHLVQEDLWVSPGDFVEEFTGANKTIGTLVLRFDTNAEAEYALTTVNDWLKVEVA